MHELTVSAKLCGVAYRDTLLADKIVSIFYIFDKTDVVTSNLLRLISIFTIL